MEKQLLMMNLNHQFKNYKIKEQPLSIYLSNIYYEDELKLSTSNTYTKSNFFKKVIGLDKYDTNRYTIFINNTDDYNALYNKPSYQSSVYVKDEKTIEDTLMQLEKLGLKPKKVNRF